MIKQYKIQVFEHEKLLLGNKGLHQKHLDALLKLNQFHDNHYFDPIYKGIKFKQYVGVIQVDGLSIEIHPKADKSDSEIKWKGVLLQMLHACGKLKPSSSGAANVSRQNLNLLDVYFELFLSELNQLIRKGLVKQYYTESKNMKALKGKLEFSQNIQKNVVHKERFFTTHQIYGTDHLLHQILLKALKILEQFTKGTHLYDQCKRVLLNFPEVKTIEVNQKVLNQIKLNRKSAPYQFSLELARLIILNYSPDISSGNEKMLSLLFDMNELWEQYVFIQLKKELAGSNYIVKEQDRKAFLGSHFLQPDIVIYDKFNPKITYVIDTKWKRPDHYRANIADLRQMYTYGRFWDAEKVMLLYPGSHRHQGFRYFKTEDFLQTEQGHEQIAHQCRLSFVTVVDEDGQLNSSLAKNILNRLTIVNYKPDENNTQ